MFFNIIKDINKSNFLYGGLIYHHKEVTDLDERDKEFEEMKKILTGDGDISTNKGIKTLYTQIEEIKYSQSLTKKATEEFYGVMNKSEEPHPLDKVYLANEDQDKNVFIRDNIKLLDSDKIIFIQYVGVIGDTYNYDVEGHMLNIVYEYNSDLEIYIGKVIDGKLMDDFLQYKKRIKEGAL